MTNFRIGRSQGTSNTGITDGVELHPQLLVNDPVYVSGTASSRSLEFRVDSRLPGSNDRTAFSRISQIPGDGGLATTLPKRISTWVQKLAGLGWSAKEVQDLLIYVVQIVFNPTRLPLQRHATTFSSWRGVNDWARSRFDH
jgi:hypothetical protein